METLAGRHAFDKNLYEKNDPAGKAKAIKILSQTKSFMSGASMIFDPIEDKQCGDVKIKFVNDNSILVYEVENSGYDRFDINFKGGYPTVNVPMKDFKSIPDGYFMAVDGGESEFVDIPKRFYLIEIKYILEANIAANVNKESDGKKENFYKVPSHLAKRYQWNEEKRTYKLVKL